ncbi:MAG TPA: bifunctional uridylyltransferase/uridylyl-removing protein, partial [Xanthobacteraceae bacterium]|nr:bifunctional uridylyltransferase/uridylyl-removing protein [Xanthobacteraceae bacterium]
MLFDPSKHGDVFNSAEVSAALDQLAAQYAGRENELRSAMAKRLKLALTDGRAAAEQLLLKERQGRLCAERLCFMQDEIIRILFDFIGKHLYQSRNPSEAERMAIVATGGY